MSGDSIPYPLGGTETEKQRLLHQAKEYEGSSDWLLDEIGIEAGWRTADIGCGPIGILNLLSERVGPGGAVLGVEREARFVQMAQDEVRHRHLANVEIIQADAMQTGLKKGSLDFVHERLVLLNVNDRPAFVRELVSLTRPGGVVALEDIDNCSWTCHPGHPSWDALLNVFHTIFHKSGGNGFMGRQLPSLMKGAGITEPKTRIHVEFAEIGRYRRTHLLSLIESLRDRITGANVMGADELDRHRRLLLEHLARPDVSVLDKLLVQCWGWKV